MVKIELRTVLGWITSFYCMVTAKTRSKYTMNSCFMVREIQEALRLCRIRGSLFPDSMGNRRGLFPNEGALFYQIIIPA